MSRFLSSRFRSLTPYTPGEQPRGRTYIKLNTNESPFKVSEKALKKAAETVRPFQLYSDTECLAFREKLAEVLKVDADEVMATNGSDEALNLAFMTFCDEDTPALFPDITYGFYRVYADVNRLPFEEIPLREDFSLALSDYEGKKGTVFLANPNAPTGLALSRSEIESWLQRHPDNMLVADEAYVDFGAESCVPLIRKYPNLLVIQTFSKSRALAGARLGFAVGCRDLIRDLNTLRYATAPYNVNSYTQALGLAVLEEEDRTRKNCLTIMENRAWTESMLKELGFHVLSSSTNFVFARCSRMSGKELQARLRGKGILTRRFDVERIRDYQRITIGTMEQMRQLKTALNEIFTEDDSHAERAD